MKWYGKIGYSDYVETEPGVWEPKITEMSCIGDIIRNYKADKQGTIINGDISITNQISVISNPYLSNNFHKIKYITFGGAKWKVSTVEVRYPRIIVSLGSLYLEDEEESEDDN